MRLEVHAFFDLNPFIVEGLDDSGQRKYSYAHPSIRMKKQRSGYDASMLSALHDAAEVAKG